MSRRRRCLNEAEMAAVVDGTAGFEQTEHLLTCKRCRETRDLIAALIRAFGDEIEAADDALSRVEKRGRDCVSRIEGGVAPHRWQFAATRDGASPAIANAMLDRFEALMDIASPDALSMADAAISIAGFAAELVADDGASLRCRAWKAKAVALASFACYDEALEALDEACGRGGHRLRASLALWQSGCVAPSGSAGNPGEALRSVRPGLRRAFPLRSPASGGHSGALRRSRDRGTGVEPARPPDGNARGARDGIR